MTDISTEQAYQRLWEAVHDLGKVMHPREQTSAIPLRELSECWEALKRIATDRYGLKMRELHGEANGLRTARLAAIKRADDDLKSRGL